MEQMVSQLAEVQSDKATVDIGARYTGIVKKLYYQADDTVQTGKALVDIDVVDEGTLAEDESPAQEATQAQAEREAAAEDVKSEGSQLEEVAAAPEPTPKHATLATPAVRGLLKEHGIEITDIKGTGKDGRVMKSDVHDYLAQRDAAPAAADDSPTFSRPSPTVDTQQKETAKPLGAIQAQMFKAMTKSLTIPHFLYTDELNVGRLAELRSRLKTNARNPQKFSYLPFVVKAVSLALDHYPLLNARVDTDLDPGKPKLIMRSNHNIGVAMDTPQGLLVPNVKNVGARSILDTASELSRLGSLAKEGKLGPSDLSGGTITVSNIGSIGGTYVAPVCVTSEVAILGIGKSKVVPVFDDAGNVTKAETINFSWSADHRVIDGATMARMAEKVREYVENPELMVLDLR